MDKTGLKVDTGKVFISWADTRALFGYAQNFANSIIVHDLLPFGGVATLNDALNDDGGQAGKVNAFPLIFPQQVPADNRVWRTGAHDLTFYKGNFLLQELLVLSGMMLVMLRVSLHFDGFIHMFDGKIYFESKTTEGVFTYQRVDYEVYSLEFNPRYVDFTQGFGYLISVAKTSQADYIHNRMPVRYPRRR
jgi:hypothetical protein